MKRTSRERLLLEVIRALFKELWFDGQQPMDSDAFNASVDEWLDIWTDMESTARLLRSVRG